MSDAIVSGFARMLRGSRASRVLARFGVDPRRYWLLVDVFGQLSDRGEVLDQLGRDGLALKTAAWLYFAMSAFLSLMFVMAGPGVMAYSSIFLAFTALLLTSVLMLEAANSLMNPVEASVLAYQPIGGATYTAAKLTHLLRIVLYLVPGLNAVPAFAGLALEGSPWWFPAAHLLVALLAGLVAALLCCAVFGWLLRFVPPQRLKAAAQIAAGVPFFALFWAAQLRQWVVGSAVLDVIPDQPMARWSLGLGFVAATACACVLGIRSLSAGYMVRVSGLAKGGSAAGARSGRSPLAEVAGRFFGGQAARAGFTFVSRMMRRDWQFRRQMIPLLPMLLPVIPLAASGWNISPFSGRFSSMHVLPHAFGVVLFFICNFLAYGNDYKGTWMFLLAPSHAFGGFARGVYASLWLRIVLLPHAVMLLVFGWAWGGWQAGLFVAYSVAVASTYLALELRLIEAVPFSRQVDPSRGAVLLPLMIGGVIVIAVALAVQHFLIFRSPATVAFTTAGLSVAAYFLTRSSLHAYEVSIRYNLGLLSAETGTLYKEVNA